MPIYTVDLLRFGRTTVSPELAAMDVVNEIRQRQATVTATVRDLTTGKTTIVTVTAKGKDYTSQRIADFSEPSAPSRSKASSHDVKDGSES